jgi:hypothetical protein
LSTQMTSLPISAKHAPETSPTYPVPITQTFMFSSIFLERTALSAGLFLAVNPE